MAKKKEKITFHSVLMAEDLRQEVTGLQSLIGVFPRRIESTTQILQMPKIIFRVEFDSEENFQAKCFFFVTSPSGTKVFNNPTPMEVDIKKETPNVCAFGWAPAVFSESGDYELKFSIDDKYTTVTKFRVLLAKKT